MSLTKSGLGTFIQVLQTCSLENDVFNPWSDYDPIYDASPQSPQIRMEQLRAFLSPRILKAKWILVAEAVSYQGGKFSGVPLTSERILLGHQKGILPDVVLPAFTPCRTSLPRTAPAKAVQQLGYTEPTATIMWNLLQNLLSSPVEAILWNIFPFHPYESKRGRLSNRAPRAEELRLGLDLFGKLKDLCANDVSIIAIGNKASATLGTEYGKVRHPANGGAAKFRQQLPELMGFGRK